MANYDMDKLVLAGFDGEHVDDTFTMEGVKIDNTLSVTGRAADAKKTGDEIGALKEDLSAVFDGDGQFYFKWEQGNLALSTGAEETATFAIRTPLMAFNSHCVITPYYDNSGTRTDLLKYNQDGTYSGVFVANIKKDYTIGDDDGQYLIRFRIINVNFQSVTPSVGANTHYKYTEYHNIISISDELEINRIDIDGLYDGKHKFRWETGNLALSTGKEEDSIFCLRTYFTGFDQPVIIHPYIASGYSNYILKYDTSKNFVSYEFFNSDYYINDTNALYKLKLLKTDLTSIDISLGDNIYYDARSVGSLYGKKVVCFGDSIVGNFIPPNDWPSTFASITGATVYNAGFGGCCMADNNQARRAYAMCRLADSIASGDWSVQEDSGVTIDYAKVNSAGTSYEATGVDYVADKLAMLEAIDWSTIDYIIIAYGTNDWSSDFLLDNQNNKLDTTTYLGAFRYSVETILTAYPNIKILPVTPIWRWWDTNTGAGAYGDSDTVANSVSHVKLWEMADGLKDACKIPYHLHVCDLYYNSGFNKQNRYQYFFTNDGTHPKPYGIKQLGIKIANALMNGIAK